MKHSPVGARFVELLQEKSRRLSVVSGSAGGLPCRRCARPSYPGHPRHDHVDHEPRFAIPDEMKPRTGSHPAGRRHSFAGEREDSAPSSTKRAGTSLLRPAGTPLPDRLACTACRRGVSRQPVESEIHKGHELRLRPRCSLRDLELPFVSRSTSETPPRGARPARSRRAGGRKELAERGRTMYA